MLKGRYKAISFSIIIHAFIFYLISKTVVVPPIHNETKPQAIKSFIYTPPKQVAKTVEAPNENHATTQTLENEITPDTATPSVTVKQTVEEVEIMEQNLTSPSEETSPSEQVAQPPKNFSAYGQLNNLKKQLNDKIIANESIQFGRSKTASILDGTPELVPHSTKQLSDDEIKKQTSQQISSDIQITKGDDGRCSIERDLSVVGMEGVKSVEGFSCGKSKFDKNFQEHMKKVLTKLGK